MAEDRGPYRKNKQRDPDTGFRNSYGRAVDRADVASQELEAARKAPLKNVFDNFSDIKNASEKAAKTRNEVDRAFENSFGYKYNNGGRIRGVGVAKRGFGRGKIC